MGNGCQTVVIENSEQVREVSSSAPTTVALLEATVGWLKKIYEQNQVLDKEKIKIKINVECLELDDTKDRQYNIPKKTIFLMFQCRENEDILYSFLANTVTNRTNPYMTLKAKKVYKTPLFSINQAIENNIIYFAVTTPHTTIEIQTMEII